MSLNKPYFEVACCGRRRGLLPGNILVCSRCDFDNDKATVIPNENKACDVPDGIWFLYFEALGGKE